MARTLFDEGWVTQHGSHVGALDLPLAPAPPDPPRLLLGGGSKTILELAGRYADHIDLAPPPRPGANQFQRPLLTTTDELAASARTARAGVRELTTSLLLSALVVCDAGSVDDEEAALCARVGLAPRALERLPLRADRATGTTRRAHTGAGERIGLDWLIIPLAALEPFASDVMPLFA